MADQSFRVKNGLSVGIGGTVITTLSSGNVGLGTTNPTEKLWVDGNGYFTGILTANRIFSSVYGEFTGGSISGTDIVGTALSISGISTFANGPVFIGSGTSTGTASQRLQVTGGAYVSQNLGIGTTDPTSKLTVQGDASVSGLTTTNNLYVSGVGTFQTQITASGTINLTGQAAGVSHVFGSNQTTSVITIGGVSGTGAITLGQAITQQTLNLATGTSGVGTTKTINIGTRGAAGSFTIINIGPTAGVGTAVISSGTNLLLGTTTSTGTASQRLQVNGGAYISGSVGVGTTNPQYIFTVTDTGTAATAGLTNCLADFTTTANSYGQINLRNTSSGTNASSDVIITTDNGNDSTNYIDLGINNSGYSVGSWTINGANDGYLYTSDGNLSIGAINASVAKYISFFTGGTLLSNERMRINATGVGIGTTNPTEKLSVSGNAHISGNVTATEFYGSGQFLTNITPSSNLTGISTLGFFSDNQNITSNVTLPSNTLLYTVHKNINVATGSTITIGSGSTIIMDRLNNLDDVVAISFKGDGSQLTGIPVGDLYELDQISPAGGENTYTPTFNYDTVAVSDPFRLLISVNGIMQSAYVHNTEYVFNNSLLASRTGYTIDYDGKIKFTEVLPVGSEVMIKTTAGTTKSTTRKYPFNALDVLF